MNQALLLALALAFGQVQTGRQQPSGIATLGASGVAVLNAEPVKDQSVIPPPAVQPSLPPAIGQTYQTPIASYGVPAAQAYGATPFAHMPYYSQNLQPAFQMANGHGTRCQCDSDCFFERLCKIYCDEFFPKKEEKNGNGKDEKNGDKAPEPAPPPRRAIPVAAVSLWRIPGFSAHRRSGE
jgi:hypothetical protein